MSQVSDGRSDLSALCGVPVYQRERAHLFPSEESLRWFVRRHKRSLIDAGALLMIAGRLTINPALFDRVVLTVGQQSARRAA